MSGGNASRIPGGQADGGLAGVYPGNVALGMPLAVGLAFIEDFQSRDDTAGGFYGDRGWSRVLGAVSIVTPTSTNEHEFGLRQLTTTGGIGDRAILSQDFDFTDQEPPIGSVLDIKARLQNLTTSCDAWLGLASDSTTAPITGATVDFIGVRYSSASNSWFGVSRTGAAETALDLSIAGSTSADAYARCGFQRLNDGSYEFYTLARQTDERVAPVRTVIGTIDANHPALPLRPVIGIRTSVAASRYLVVDYYTLCGRCRR